MGIFRRTATVELSNYSSASYEVPDLGFGRLETELLAPRPAAADPYAAWLEQREAEAQRDAPQIRWSYRYEAPDRGDAEDGLVTA